MKSNLSPDLEGPSMYTLIRHLDSRVTLRTHVDPARLSPDEAARLLRGLHPLLAILARRAGSAPDVERPGAAEPDAAAAPLPVEARALAS